MDCCSEKPSDRPEIEEFEKRFKHLTMEFNALIEEDFEKYGNNFM